MFKQINIIYGNNHEQMLDDYSKQQPNSVKLLLALYLKSLFFYFVLMKAAFNFYYSYFDLWGTENVASRLIYYNGRKKEKDLSLNGAEKISSEPSLLDVVFIQERDLLYRWVVFSRSFL